MKTMERLYWFSGNGTLYHCKYFIDMDFSVHGIQIYELSTMLMIGFIEDLVIPDDNDMEGIYDFNNEIHEFLTNKFI